MPLSNDHFVPQTYLRGFIDPAAPISDKRLCVFSKRSGTWSRKSPPQICSLPEFDGHSNPSVAAAYAAELWAEENAWPVVLAAVRATQYRAWSAQLPKLLRFLAYLTLRSPLFRIHLLTMLKTPLTDLTSLKHQDAIVDTARRDSAFLLAFLRGLNWTLFTGGSAALPVLTSDQPVFLSDLNVTKRDLPSALRDGGFAVAFPVALDCCLVGSDQPVPSPLQTLSSENALQLWEGTTDTAMDLVISPVQFQLPGI